MSHPKKHMTAEDKYWYKQYLKIKRDVQNANTRLAQRRAEILALSEQLQSAREDNARLARLVECSPEQLQSLLSAAQLLKPHDKSIQQLSGLVSPYLGVLEAMASAAAARAKERQSSSLAPAEQSNE